MSEPEYKYPKEDIEKMLRYLRLTLPKYATPEKAIYLLEHSHVHLKNLEKLHPDVIEDILKDFESH